MNLAYTQVVKKLGKVKKKEPLASYTTFKIGGPADLLYEAETNKELIRAIRLAKKLGIPFFILGGGSNLLVSDKGFRGMVIKVQGSRFKVQDEKIIAEAGVSLARLVKAAADNSLSGLEFAAGIPGTIGGAIYGNAGVQKKEEPTGSIGDRVESVTLLMPSGKIKRVGQKWMGFGYRESRLKSYPPDERPIVLSVVLRLKKGKGEVIEQLIKEKLKRRAEKIPPESSAGCIFKNPPNTSAGLLIDKTGLKGKRIGDAQISEKHANFIVNRGRATAKEVVQLIKLAKKRVKEKFNIKLEEEICLLGFAKINLAGSESQ